MFRHHSCITIFEIEIKKDLKLSLQISYKSPWLTMAIRVLSHVRTVKLKELPLYHRGRGADTFNVPILLDKPLYVIEVF